MDTMMHAHILKYNLSPQMHNAWRHTHQTKSQLSPFMNIKIEITI